jgi:hypothetical protein
MCKKLMYFMSIALVMIMSAGAIGADTIWEGQITDDMDDVEQQGSSVDTGSSDLEFMGDGNTEVGIRFLSVIVPKGSAISKAYLEFQVDELEGDVPANLLIYGELSASAPAFASSANNVTNRPLTAARVAWSPEHYPTVGEKKQTTDISAVIEEIVGQPGWSSGNALVLIIIEDPDNLTAGFRTVEAGPGDDSSLLHIEWGSPTKAKGPAPAEGVDEVSRDTVLGWQPSPFAQTHNVYLGTVADDLSAISQGQAATSLDPGRLDFGQTYYWRVDEVNGAPDRTVFEGDVWSFTVEPQAVPVTNITATASAENLGMEAEKTIDGSGLNAMDQHSMEAQDMWLGAGADNWIQYDFDRAYKLQEMLVWNSNQPVESFLGFGVKEMTIEYSADGQIWAALDGVTTVAQAPGLATYQGGSVALGGITATSIKLSVVSAYGFIGQSGLSEVRFMAIPVSAREPVPANGAAVDSVTVDLGWRVGREAASHEVNLGADPAALDIVDTTTENATTVSGLDFSTTYSWSITEVNDAETPTTHASEVWSFTTPDYEVVEDFDGYTDDMDAGEAIFQAWIDGFDDNSNGSLVGNDISPFAEQTTVQSGQSMPFFYANAGAGKSEATLDLDQDWDTSGIQVLSLAFYGQVGNSGNLYAKVNDAKISYGGSASSLTIEAWQTWNIDLTSVNTNLQRVTSLTIGVEGASAQGLFYIDDIRLYPSAPAPINEWRIAASSDDAEEEVETGTMESMTSSDLELGYEDGTIPQFVGCRWAGIPSPQGATITEAWVQFSADSVGAAQHALPVSVIIEGELSPGPATFTTNIGGRPKTAASVVWDIPEWLTTHAMGPEERSPDISSVIQELVDQPGWAGQAIVLIFSDNPANPSQGTREAESFDGTADEAPLLHIVYE